jgi:MmyB-like transcription regulator ligand binding domain
VSRTCTTESSAELHLTTLTDRIEVDFAFGHHRPRSVRPHRGAGDAERDVPNALGDAQRDVHDSGVKRLHHPLVGELTLTYETMELTANQGLTIAVYTAEPGSKFDQALNLLASWTATPDQPQSAGAPDR